MRVEFDASLCFGEIDFADLAARARKKFEKEKNEGRIDFYFIFEDRLRELTHKIKGQTRPEEADGVKLALTLGIGAKKLMGLAVSPAPDNKSAFLLSFNTPSSLIQSWNFEVLNAVIESECDKLGIKERGNPAQIQATLLRGARGERVHHAVVSKVSELTNPDNKPYKIIANHARREAALIIFDAMVLRNNSILQRVENTGRQAVEKLVASGIDYDFTRNQLLEALTQAVEGPERFGIGLPVVALLALGYQEEARAKPRQEEAVTPPAKKSIFKKPTPAPEPRTPQVKKTAAAMADAERYESEAPENVSYLGRNMLHIGVSADQFSAEVVAVDQLLYQIPDFLPDPEYVKNEARRVGVTHGFEEKAIANVLKAIMGRQAAKGLLVAVGRAGIAPKGHYLHKSYRDAKSIGDHDIIDIRKQQSLDLVNAGQLVAELRFKNPGQVGMTVFGEEVIPATEEQFTIRIGEGVEEREEGRFYATIDGMPVIDGDAIAVSPSYLHKGDINLKTGDIYFNGNVIIEGAIDNGASVVVTGDLIVKGTIGSAFVRVGGSIECMQGITTTERGTVRAKKTIRASFISNSRIFCGGDLIVKKSILNSYAAVGGVIECGKNGVLAGGEYTCREFIKVGKLGLPQGAPTQCRVGIDPAVDFRLKLVNLRMEKLGRVENEDKLALREMVRKSKAQTTSKHEDKKQQLQGKLTRVRGILQRLKGQEQALTTGLRWNKECCIMVYDSLYPNVELTVGGVKIPVKHEVKEVIVSPERHAGSYIRPMEKGDAEPQRLDDDIAS